MGYNTRYEITQVTGDVSRLRAAFDKHAQAEKNGYRWFGVGVVSERMTWYEHEAHIAQAMMAAGTPVLVLKGEGEEQGDVWEKQFTLELKGRRKVVHVQKYVYELVRKEIPETTTIEEEVTRGG